jgi:hypothetical protein
VLDAPENLTTVPALKKNDHKNFGNLNKGNEVKPETP